MLTMKVMTLPKLTHYLLLTLFSLLLLLPGIVKMPVMDRDEAHFAQASRQMVQTGNYFQIRFQETTRFRKPPGINWLQAASVKLFSNPDANIIWPYRIPSLLGALISILLTYFFSRRFLGQTVAVLAAVMLASTLLLVVESHMAVIDASLLSSVVLMQGALWIIYQAGIEGKRVHWGWAACFWLAMTYGLVLKGVTPLVGILSIIALCLVERRIAWLRNLQVMKGVLVFIALSLAWIIMVNEAEHSNYLLQVIHRDLLPKLKGGHESHGKPPLFHLLILPLTFWPASLFLWQAGVHAVKHRREKVIKFLLAWIIPTWIFFELMPTKLPQYVLPTFPAIALLCALAIQGDNHDKKPGKWLHLLQVLWVVLSTGLALSFVSLPYLVMQQFTLASVALCISIVVLSVIAARFAWNGIYRQAYLTTLLIALISYSLIFTALLPQLKPVWLTSNLVQLVNGKAIADDKPLLVVGFDEPSLVFNLNTKSVQFVNGVLAGQILQSDPSRIAIVEANHFAHWENSFMDLAILGRIKGFNYSKGHWVELFLIGQQKPGVSHVTL
ncbi:ArnT family glycosyltransferase [Legionella maceachernii]|nr:glycosyltransferase family 39 protein [Legionella maceachernii]